MSQLKEIDWDARVVDGGTDALASSPRLRTSPQAVQADEGTQGKVEEIAEGTDAFSREWAKRDRKVLTDAFAACFEPYPQLEEATCEEQDRKDFFRGVLKSPDFEELHASTELNIDASAIGAISLTNQYVEYASRPKPKNEAKRRMQAEQEGRKAAENARDEAAGVRHRAGTAAPEEQASPGDHPPGGQVPAAGRPDATEQAHPLRGRGGRG